MSDYNDLKLFLRQRYDREAWRPRLRQLFGNGRIEFFVPHAVAELPNPDSDRVFAMRQFGFVDLGEPTFFGTQHRLALVEVELKPDTTIIGRNRVGLRALTYPFVDGVRAHGVLAFYYDPEQADYRLSFQTRYVKKTEDDITTSSLSGADRRRYTFVLGPYEAATTAAGRLGDLSRKSGRSTLQDVLDAFSVEKLSNDFFTTYKKFYFEFSDYLAENYRPLFQDAETKQSLTAKRPAAKAKREAQEKPIRDYAKRLLGRLVFLHFLQKKGWMGCPTNAANWEGGDPEFVRTIFDKFSDKKRFHSQCLTGLFFNTLNVRRANDVLEIPGLSLTCRVPYLNGGLFEEEAQIDSRLIDFPSDLFDRLLRFFSEYNFTIEENRPDDHDVGIDPEMLGHIFENLLEENRSKGAIYTPRPIVQYMCQESLIGYLSTHLAKFGIAREPIAAFIRAPFEQVPALLRQYAEQLDNLLKTVRICDPAIGSGAFPIGLLQELFIARLYLYPHLSKDNLKSFDPGEVKRHIIEQNVYGVDLDPGAVDIARLRFWLALVVDATNPFPLPNLNYKVMQGNSLLESFRGIELHHTRPPHRITREITAASLFGNEPESTVNEEQAAYIAAWNQDLDILLAFFFVAGNEEETRRLLQQYPEQNELAYLSKQELRNRIEAWVAGRFEYEIGASLEEARLKLELAEQKLLDANIRLDERDTAAQRKKKEVALAKHLNVISIEEARVKKFEEDAAELRAHQVSAEAGNTVQEYYFLWHIYFKNVFKEKQGFDIVIANPPYMRVQEVTGSQGSVKPEYARAYARIANGAYDLANLFIMKSLGDPGHETNDKIPPINALLNPDGTGCFILPHKFFNAAGGEDFRDVLLKNRYLDRVIHFGANRVFHGVDTYVAIVLFSPSPRDDEFQMQRIPYGTSDFGPHLRNDQYFASVPYNSLRKAIDYYGSNQIILLDSQEEYDLFERIYQRKINNANSEEKKPAVLGDILEIFVGLQTSNDKLYVLTTEPNLETSNSYFGHNQLEPDKVWELDKVWFRPMLRGRDVHRYDILTTDNIVFFPYTIDHVVNKKTKEIEERAFPVPLELLEKQFPKTAEYVLCYEQEFKNREEGKAANWDEWYEYLYPKNLAKFGEESLVSMEICVNHPNVTINHGQFYHSTTVYSWVKKVDVPESYNYLLALANSRVLWWFLKRTGDTLQGDARRLKSNYLNPFPLPPQPIKEECAALEKLVYYQLWLHNPKYPSAVESLPNNAVAQYFQQVIDLCVCELYLREHMMAQEVDILKFVVAQLPPHSENAPETEAGAIAHVFRRWQAPDSLIRQRLQLATIRSPHWLGAIFSA